MKNKLAFGTGYLIMTISELFRQNFGCNHPAYVVKYKYALAPHLIFLCGGLQAFYSVIGCQNVPKMR